MNDDERENSVPALVLEGSKECANISERSNVSGDNSAIHNNHISRIKDIAIFQVKVHKHVNLPKIRRKLGTTKDSIEEEKDGWEISSIGDRTGPAFLDVCLVNGTKALGGGRLVKKEEE